MIHFVFLANRTDGLGQRLKAMIQAMALAEQFNGDFRFSWTDRSQRQREFHATESMASCFSPAFIARHADPDAASREMISFADFLREWRQEAAAAQQNGKAGNGATADRVITVIAPTAASGPAAAWLRRSRPAGALTRAFNGIGFSDANAMAIAAARTFALPHPITALHLRSGDVLYGAFRFMDRFMDKVLPYQVAESLLNDLGQQQIPTLVFGQDEDLCRALCAGGEDRILAADLVPAFCRTPTQRALFEIALMARASHIVCGHSGFPEIAAIIGHVPSTDIAKVFDAERRIDMILRGGSAAVTAIASPQQKAFSLFYVAHHLLHNPAQDAAAIAILEQALTLTPDNGFYAFLRAALLYRSGQEDAAEAAIAEILLREGDGALYFVLTDQNRPAHAYLPLLLPSARRGLPMAALCVAIEARVKNDDLVQACILQALQVELPPIWINRLEAARTVAAAG